MLPACGVETGKIFCFWIDVPHNLRWAFRPPNRPFKCHIQTSKVGHPPAPYRVTSWFLYRKCLAAPIRGVIARHQYSWVYHFQKFFPDWIPEVIADIIRFVNPISSGLFFPWVLRGELLTIPPNQNWELHAKGQVRSTKNKKMAAILNFAPSEDDISELSFKKFYFIFYKFNQGPFFCKHPNF